MLEASIVPIVVEANVIECIADAIVSGFIVVFPHYLPNHT
uniref:Uncharacterized protein n=1 Tax=Bartonella schoenbuchensis (strain DSM 13525 / NCTC 13165 / R1) TaxID=687861 RepID=E6Z114_BARSR|nr:hypothetical protein BARSC_190073 [Bartonella schoenbuchensis R1]